MSKDFGLSLKGSPKSKSPRDKDLSPPENSPKVAHLPKISPKNEAKKSPLEKTVSQDIQKTPFKSPRKSSRNKSPESEQPRHTELAKKRVSIMSDRNSPQMFRTGMLNQQSTNNFSQRSRANLATMASGYGTLPRDQFHRGSKRTLRASGSSRHSFKFRHPAPTMYSKRSSRLFEPNEDDDVRTAIMKMKYKKILQMKIQIQQMQELNKFKKAMNFEK